MNNKKLYEVSFVCRALLFFWLYIPHLFVYFVIAKYCAGGGCKWLIDSDLCRQREGFRLNVPNWLLLLHLLHNNRFFRTLFYYRIGAVCRVLIRWIRPGSESFIINPEVKIGPGFMFYHPFSTIIGPISIGKNFTCIHGTTIGKTDKGMVTIGDNVSLGANVTIIGPVHIGNNVYVGANTLVLKDIPDNCVVIGNPARILRYKNV